MEELTECPRCGRLRPRSSTSSLKGNCPYCLLAFALGEDKDAPPGDEAGGEAGGLPAPLERLGPYTVRAPLGTGGMGTVYRARHEGLSRDVALKVLKPEFASQSGFTERFQREGQVLAALDHPNIVGVHDLGCEAGVYYLAMELVEGETLRDRLRRGAIPQAEALALFRQIAGALDAAHQSGVVHRDIKPENVLVDAKGNVKIADFGIAKLLEGARAEGTPGTEVGMVAGTRSYMAPEQLEPGRPIDHRADLYSLAVVFYEMLTGELPLGVFPLASVKSNVDPRLDGPLLGALAKNPEKRPASARAFREEVEQALDARLAAAVAEDSAAPVPEKIHWLRPVVGIGALVALLGVVAWATQGPTPAPTPRPVMVAPPPVPPARPNGFLEQKERVWDVGFSPRDNVVASAGDDGLVSFWRIEAGPPLSSLAAYPHPEFGYLRLAWSPAEPILATAGGENVARLWNLQAAPTTVPLERAVLRGHSREIVALAFSPDGARVATGSHDRSVKVWTTSDGKLERTLTGPLDPVLCVAFSPDGKRIAGGVMNGAVKLWDLDGTERPSATGHAKRVWGVAFSAEGYLVSASHDGTVKVCDPDKKTLLHTLKTDGSEVWSVAVSRHAGLLACGSQGGKVTFWNYQTGMLVSETKSHSSAVVSVRFSPDDKWLASGGIDRRARVAKVEDWIREGAP